MKWIIFTGAIPAELSPAAVLQIRTDIEAHVDKSPFFKLSELLLDEIKQQRSLRLTANGNLPVRICEMLCDQNLIHWHYMKYVKRIREEEIPYLWPLKQYLLDQGLVKKRNNSLSLTKTGAKLLAGLWSCFSIWEDAFIGAIFIHWTIMEKAGSWGGHIHYFCFSKYGSHPRKSDFYSLKLMRAFKPDLYEYHQTKERLDAFEDYHYAYQTRFFECFANWLGLIEVKQKIAPSVSYLERLTTQKSVLFDQLFKIEVKNKVQ